MSRLRRIAVNIEITELTGRNEHHIQIRDWATGTDDEVRGHLRDLMTQATDSLRVHDAEVIEEANHG